MIAPLKFVWDYLSPLLLGELQERMKPAEVGKRRSFELYQLLERVAFDSDEFVAQLGDFVATMEAHPTLEQQERVKGRLGEAVSSLADSIRGLEEQVRLLNPQLSVHAPEFVHDVHRYSFDRSQMLPGVTAAVRRYLDLDAFAQKDLSQLRLLFERASQNNARIRAATNQFRAFLAEQYRYGESF
jgi:hypothetical protein